MTLFAAAAISCHEPVETELRPVELQVDVLDAAIVADLMPFVPPDPVSCSVTLLVENASPSSAVSGLRFTGGILRRTSGSEPIDTFSFSTPWDGILAPLEADTVRLTKLSGGALSGPPPCWELVDLSLAISGVNGFLRIVVADSIPFECFL